MAQEKEREEDLGELTERNNGDEVEGTPFTVDERVTSEGEDLSEIYPCTLYICSSVLEEAKEMEQKMQRASAGFQTGAELLNGLAAAFSLDDLGEVADAVRNLSAFTGDLASSFSNVARETFMGHWFVIAEFNRGPSKKPLFRLYELAQRDSGRRRQKIAGTAYKLHLVEGNEHRLQSLKFAGLNISPSQLFLVCRANELNGQEYQMLTDNCQKWVRIFVYDAHTESGKKLPRGAFEAEALLQSGGSYIVSSAVQQVAKFGKKTKRLVGSG